ncbi:ABC transporter ATP-binding protein, partial [Eubacteriales bacterium OttesenSCG-928-A19]|nr:ABC transporter ATP-binding protein [Eubacteriales bacterium OttesenSCG-928-A19]
MIKILKYLRGAKWTVVLIVALLIVQASCDLALPQYTSGIVDVGIQQGGIEYAAPERLRGSSMQTLRVLMTTAERETVDAAYTLEADGNYVRNTSDTAAIEALDAAFSLPMAIVYTAQSSDMLSQGTAALAQGAQPEAGGGTSMDAAAAMGAALLSGETPTDEQVLALREGALSIVEGVNDSMVKQTAIQYIREEYEALGMDLGGIQTRYLLLTGAKMLGVTVVMVAAAILVSLLAARTAAQLGLNLRGQVFERVVSFSSGDMDKFSTASLITRSTNDIQQVQQVTVMLLRMVIYAPILGIGGVIKVVGTSTGMGWIIFVALAAVSVLVIVLMRLAMPKFRAMQSLVDRINLIAREILTGLSVIRAFGRGEHEEERFDGANTDLMKTQLFTNRVMTLMMPIMMLIMNVVTLMIVWFGAQGIDMGTLQVGNMMAFITYTMQIVMSFLMLTMVSVMLPRATVAAGRIDEVLNTEPTIRDGGDVQANARADWHGIVAFEDVSFRYPDA